MVSAASKLGSGWPPQSYVLIDSLLEMFANLRIFYISKIVHSILQIRLNSNTTAATYDSLNRGLDHDLHSAVSTVACEFEILDARLVTLGPLRKIACRFIAVYNSSDS